MDEDLFMCNVENYSNIAHLCCELFINVWNFGYNWIYFYHILIYISDVVSYLILELWIPIIKQVYINKDIHTI